MKTLEKPSAAPTQEIHQLETGSVGSEALGTKKWEITDVSGNPLAVEPFNEANIDALLITLLKRNESSSKEGVNQSEGDIVEKGNLAKIADEKRKKIKADVDILKNIFSPSNNEIFLVKAESIQNLDSKTTLCAAIVANKSEKLQSDLQGKNYKIEADGNKGFYARSGDILLYFAYGQEKHEAKQPDQEKEELPKAA